MPKYKASELIGYVTELQEDEEMEYGYNKEHFDMLEEVGKRLLELEKIKEEDWEKGLEDYINSTEHQWNCAANDEGLECCLEKEWIKKFIKKTIKGE